MFGKQHSQKNILRDLAKYNAVSTLDYTLSIIAIQNPSVESYKTAKFVLYAIKKRLENKKSSQPSKEEMKIAVEVLEEIANLGAKSEREKEQNAKCAFLCKMIIDGVSKEV